MALLICTFLLTFLYYGIVIHVAIHYTHSLGDWLGIIVLALYVPVSLLLRWFAGPYRR